MENYGNYGRLCQRVEEIERGFLESKEAAREAKKVLLEQGYVITDPTGLPPSLANATRSLLQNEEYSHNPLVQRAVRGEKFIEIASDILSRHNFDLKLRRNKEKREQFNKQVGYLAQVTKYAERFFVQPFGHRLSPEGKTAVYGGSAMYISPFFLGVISPPDKTLGFVALSLGVAVGVAAIGFSGYYFENGALSGCKEIMMEELTYLDDIIQGEGL